MQLENNFVCDTDYYKFTHHLGYKKGIQSIYSYGEPRIGARFDYAMFFGAQLIMLQHFVGQVVTKEKIEYAKKKNKAWGLHDKYFNEEMWQYILKNHGGRLPLIIKAVREGTRVPISSPLFTIECLDDKLIVPLVNHSETLLSHLWYTTTIATNSFEIKKIILGFLEETGSPELIEYCCHDFGYRGGSCQEESMRGGMSHLVSFRGSDTTVADRGIDRYYGYGEPSRLKSVYATEHSVAETFGEGEGEYDYIKKQLDEMPDDAIGSIVIDTYDALNFIDNVVTREDVKSKILNRSGKIVFRPDSGNPIEITSRIINSLGNSFGYTFNKKGYKVLNPRIGIIWGDGMEYATIKSLYESLKVNKWSADNLVVGSGGGLIRKFDRDTMRFAIKASSSIIDGKVVHLIKNPATQASKKSKKGRLKLHHTGDDFLTISSAESKIEIFDSYVDSLETIFENGELIRRESFDDIITRSNEWMAIEMANPLKYNPK